MPLVSVIIPVYGVSQYIERCARSLFEQTLKDVEYIFVDDCSPDDSMTKLNALIKNYPERHGQIKILHHQQNKGLPVARQTGLKIASGDFVVHCDSDDWLDVEYFERMYNHATTTGSDIVICDYIETNGVDESKNVRRHCCYSIEKNEYIEYCMFQQNTWAVWNKMIKRDIYNLDIIYPKYSMGEDMALVLQLLYYSKKISYLEEPLYYYFYNSNSMTRKMTEEQIVRNYTQLKNNLDLLMHFYEDKELTPKMNKALNYLKYNVRTILIPLLGKNKYFVMWKNTYPDLFFPFILNGYVNISIRIKFMLTYLKIYSLKNLNYD